MDVEDKTHKLINSTFMSMEMMDISLQHRYKHHMVCKSWKKNVNSYQKREMSWKHIMNIVVISHNLLYEL